MSVMLGPYELLQPVAAGGMAEVFVALRDESVDPCILKRIHEDIGADPSMQHRFWREAEVAALLDHGSIARVLDAGEVEGRLYLAMELVWGIDLAVLIAAATDTNEALPVDVALAITRPLLEALHYAHERTDAQGTPLALVHRDISARNVLIALDGSVKLIDFGMARARVGSFRTTARKFIGGTPRYMSPEQALGREVDRRSDLYAVGVLLHEMLSGRRLVQDGDLDAVLRNVARSRPADLCSLRTDVPSALGVAVAKVLKRYPDDRWATAGEFLDAIDAAGVSPAPSASLAARVAVHASKVEAQRAQVEALVAARRRSRVAPAQTATASSGAELTTAPIAKIEILEASTNAQTVRLGEKTDDMFDDTVIHQPTNLVTAPGEQPFAPIPTPPNLAVQRPRFVWLPWVAIAAATVVAALVVLLTVRPTTAPTVSKAEVQAPKVEPVRPVVVTTRAPRAAPVAPPAEAPPPPPPVRRRVRRPPPTKAAPSPPPMSKPLASPKVAARVESPVAPVDLPRLIKRARRLRDGVEPHRALHHRANDLYSKLIFLGNAKNNEAEVRAAAKLLAELERAVEKEAP